MTQIQIGVYLQLFYSSLLFIRFIIFIIKTENKISKV